MAEQYKDLDHQKYQKEIIKLEEVDNLHPIALQATQNAAIAAAITAGYGDKKIPDEAAVEAMRSVLNNSPINVRVVVGEGDKDEAPMLYVDEKLGFSNLTTEWFVAVDPLEGTNATSNLKERASSVLVFTEQGGITRLHKKVHYMDKLIVGPEAAGKINIDAPVEENVRAIANALSRKTHEINIVVLDRPRNKELIKSIRVAGARVVGIDYGDLIPGIQTGISGSGIHAVMGIGGAPEAVLSAAGIKQLGGEVQARIWTDDEEKKKLLINEEVEVDKLYTTNDLVPGQKIIFSASGVTDNGTFLEGVKFFGNGVRVQTFQISSVKGIAEISKIDKTYIVNSNGGFKYRQR